jgi:hypothetical protein
MTSDKPLDDRRKAQEEDYFRKLNAEAAAKLKAKSDLAQAGIQDSSLIEHLTKAGFDSDSARALYLLPLVDVAWADGRVQKEEQSEILGLMEKAGISKDSKAYAQMIRWMEKGPSDQSFLQARSLLEPIVAELKKSGKDVSSWVLEAAEKVAGVTNSLFGLGSRMISKEEKAYLDSLVGKIKK